MVINPIVYDEKGKGNDVFSCNLESRVIHLVGEVTDEMAASVVAQLLHHNLQDTKTHIYMVVSF